MAPDNTTPDESWRAFLPHLESYYGLPEGLIDAIVSKESSGNVKAKGTSGERGLMQLMPGTAKHYGVINPDNLNDPRTNLETGARYLADLMRAYNGDVRRVLRAYNGGPKAAATPTPKTTAYADDIIKRWKPEESLPVPITPGSGFSAGELAPGEGEMSPPITSGTGFSGGESAPGSMPPAPPIMPSVDTRGGLSASKGPVLEIPSMAAASGPGPVEEIPSVNPNPRPTIRDIAKAPAIRADGRVIPGSVGEIHDDIIKRTPNLPVRVEHGFIGHDGMFLTRTQARDLINARGGKLGPGKPEAADLAVPTPTPTPGLGQRIVGALAPSEAQAGELPFDPNDIERITPPGGPVSPGAPELHNPIPRAAELGEEYVVAPAMMGLGALGGAAAGTAVAPGPGTAVGTIAGAGAGSATADVLNAEINKRFFGRDYSLASPGTLPGFQHPYGGLEQSAAEGAAFEGAGRYGLPAAKGLIEGRASAARAASEAAAEQDAANAAATAQAQIKAQQETVKAQGKAAEAAEKQGQANLAQRADTAAAATTAKEQLKAKGEALKRDLVDRIAADKAKLQKQILEEQAPKEAQASLQGLLGKTPEQVSAAQAMTPENTGNTALPGAQAVARRKAVQNAVFGPIRRAVKALGDKYDAVFAQYDSLPVDVSPLADTLANEEAYTTERGVVHSAQAKALMKAASQIALPDNAGGRLGDQLLEQTAQGLGYKDWRELSRLQPKLADRIAPGARSETVTTIKRLRGLRSQAAALMATGQSASDQSMGYHIASKIDDMLGESGVPKAAELNAQYGFHKNVFNRAVTREIATEIEPANLGKTLWEEPQRAILLWDGATPEEQSVLRENFGDYVLSNGFDPHKLGQRVNRDVLKRIFGDTAYGREQVWFDTESKAIGWDTLINKSPQAKDAYETAVQDRLRELGEYRAMQFRTEALKLAKELGPAGNDIIAKINAAKTPQEAAAIASDEFDRLMPGEVAARVAPTQKPAARAYYEQLQRAPGKSIAPELTSRDKAAIAALRRLPSSRLGEFAARRAKWVLPLAAAATLAGGNHPIVGYEAGIVVALMGIGGWQNLFRRSLRNPETAEAFWRAVSQPMRGDGVKSFGRQMADLAVNTAIGEATQAVKRYQGISPNSPQSQKLPFDPNDVESIAPPK